MNTKRSAVRPTKWGVMINQTSARSNTKTSQ